MERARVRRDSVTQWNIQTCDFYNRIQTCYNIKQMRTRHITDGLDLFNLIGKVYVLATKFDESYI